MLTRRGFLAALVGGLAARKLPKPRARRHRPNPTPRADHLNLEVVSRCDLRTGGVICYYPRSIAYAEGI